MLALVGFIEGYDLSMTDQLLVLAKAPLQLTEADQKWLASGPALMLCVSGFAFSAVSDHVSRKTIMLIGVIATTLLTLFIPFVQTAEQLIIVRLLTGLGAGGVVGGVPDRGRIDAGAAPAHLVYEMALALSFTAVLFIATLLAGNVNAFRFLAFAGRARGHRRAGHRLFRAPRKRALAVTQRPPAGSGRHRQPDHQAIRQPRAAADGGGAR